MHTTARRLAGALALIPMTLAIGACSDGGGGGAAVAEITENADLSDGTLPGELIADGMRDLGDWRDLMPEEGGEDLPTDDWDSDSGVVGSWFSVDDYCNYLSFYDDGSASLITEAETCYGTFTEAGSVTQLQFPDCSGSTYTSGTATLSSDTLEVSWADGTSEGYSQNAADAPASPDDGGDGTENVAEEIAGIWAGDDGSFFLVVPSQESGTGIANASYLAPGSTTECLGIILEDILGDGWDATVSCDESGEGGLLFADLTLDGEILTVSWPDTGESAAYQWYSEWDAALPDDTQES
jgi:hypothetical protein